MNLSQGQRAILTGTLLGDGCLAKHGHYHRLFVKHKDAHASLAAFKREAFREFVSMPLHRFDQRLHGRLYPCVQFVTRTNPVFSEWHSRFYRGRRKIVPRDIALDLSPLAVAVWLMDDGAADYAGVTFQTHSFRDDEVNRLAAALRERFDLEIGVRKNKGGLIVYVAAASVRQLREVVEPHLLADFTYKLEPRRSRTP